MIVSCGTYSLYSTQRLLLHGGQSSFCSPNICLNFLVCFDGFVLPPLSPGLVYMLCKDYHHPSLPSLKWTFSSSLVDFLTLHNTWLVVYHDVSFTSGSCFTSFSI